MQLSISSNEDFGVSLAQAQAMGMPAILSDWGAHKDAIGSEIIRVPARWIVERRIKEIALYILGEMARLAGENKKQNKFDELEWSVGRPMTHRRLAQARRIYGNKIKSCLDEKFFIFGCLNGEY